MRARLRRRGLAIGGIGAGALAATVALFSSGCGGGSSSSPAATSGPATTSTSGSDQFPVSRPRRGAIPHTGPVVGEDLAPSSDFAAEWGHVNPDLPSQVQWYPIGGDPHPLVDGSVSRSFRRLTLRDGDRGANDPPTRERLQLGRPYVTSRGETLMIYREGERWITYWSVRIPRVDLPVPSQMWEMYQQAGGGPPVLSFRQRGRGTLELLAKPSLSVPAESLWHRRVRPNTWLRFAVDVAYSSSPADARIRLWGSLGGSGQRLKPLTGPIRGYATLLGGGADSLIAGIYQGSADPGHSIDLANWQVARWEP